MFDPRADVYALKNFTAGGRRFKPGDKVDWRTMSVSERRVRQMAEMRLVSNTRAAPAAPAAPAVDPLAAAMAASTDELDAIDSMVELRAIAEAEGAAIKVSKADQRQAIRDKRAEA